MLILDYLSVGTMRMATGPMRVIEQEIEALAVRSGRETIGEVTDSNLRRSAKAPPSCRVAWPWSSGRGIYHGKKGRCQAAG
jgi:hypothetical protein